MQFLVVSMILALLIFGFGVWQVFIQRDASSREKFVFGSVAIGLSSIALTFQSVVLSVEFARVKGYRFQLFIHRFFMKILGDYGVSVNLAAKFYLHREFGHYGNIGFMWKCVAFACHILAKLFGRVTFGDAFSGMFNTREKATVLWLDHCKNVWGCEVRSENVERSKPVVMKTELKWLEICEIRKICKIWEMGDLSGEMRELPGYAGAAAELLGELQRLLRLLRLLGLPEPPELDYELLREVRKLRELEEPPEVRKLRQVRELELVKKLKELKELRELRELREELRKKEEMWELRELRKLEEPREVREMREVRAKLWEEQLREEVQQLQEELQQLRKVREREVWEVRELELRKLREMRKRELRELPQEGSREMLREILLQQLRDVRQQLREVRQQLREEWERLREERERLREAREPDEERELWKVMETGEQLLELGELLELGGLPQIRELRGLREIRELNQKVIEVESMPKDEKVHSWFSQVFGSLSTIFHSNDHLVEPVIEVESLRKDRVISKVIRQANLVAYFHPYSPGSQPSSAQETSTPSSSTQQKTMPDKYRYQIFATGSQDNFLSTLSYETHCGVCARDDALEFCKLLDVLDNDSFVVKGKPWGSSGTTGNILPCERWKIIVDSILKEHKKVNALRVPHVIFV